MTNDDRIKAALEFINQLVSGDGGWGDGVKALAADYAARREEIERLRNQVEYLLQRNGVLEEVNNKLRWTKDEAEAAIEKLKAQLAKIKDHCDEYLTNEDLTPDRAMRPICQKFK